ncbi:MAG: hypothetical protein IS632_09010 [Thaumarchaeota archaeon]|nr:hypothetical protein [Nitrososphaerota archaeon]
MVARRSAGRKLTCRESDTKYAARGRALGILLIADMSGGPEGNVEHTDGAPGPPDRMAKFIAICRVLLDVGPKGAGRGSHDPICGADGPVPKFEIDSTFCPAPERTTTLVPSPAGTELAGGWIRVRWDGMGFGMHLLVDPDTWRILAFSLTDESSEGAARLSGMLESTLGEYAAGGIPLPRAVARIMDAVSSGAGGRRRDLDGRMASPERKHTLGKA